MEELKHCPLCNETVFHPFLHCVDFSISKESFTLVTCSSCDFVFTNPRPGPAEIGKYYQSDVYISHHANKTGLIPAIYRLVRNRQFVNKTNIIKNHLSGSLSILDIGCGTGDFLSYCKTLGWKTTGVEPDPDALGLAKSKGLLVHDTSFLDTNSDTYDVITMWHVLEHVHDLKERLEQLGRLIKPGGLVIIAVPNHNSFDAKHYVNYWAAYDVPRHLSHFTKSSMTRLFKSFGFPLTQIHPMKYDAYYVSIKSEEYRNKSFPGNLIMGAVNGVRSNYAASGDGEYSSLIYVFKK
jgi:2-polyprenyl-3-methyl-5-hydroxy-6-metoxy-1,4-benzoquinol methylase